MELPSDFLKNMISRSANHQAVLASLTELGVRSTPVEYQVAKKQEGIAAEVANVFDIM